MTAVGADALAEKLFEIAGLTMEPPVGLSDLASAFGVTQIVKSRMIEDGALIKQGDEAIILLREDRIETRQRFTLAHELAHLILDDHPTLTVQFRQTRSSRDVEERLCDDLAAALLMPRQWIVKNYSRKSMMLRTVRALAEACNVSVSAALVRLDEICGWSSALLRWRESQGKFRFMAGAGLPLELFGDVGSSPSTNAALGSARGPDRWMDLPIAVGSQERLVRANVSVSRTALALFDFRQLLTVTKT